MPDLPIFRCHLFHTLQNAQGLLVLAKEVEGAGDLLEGVEVGGVEHAAGLEQRQRLADLSAVPLYQCFDVYWVFT